MKFLPHEAAVTGTHHVNARPASASDHGYTALAASGLQCLYLKSEVNRLTATEAMAQSLAYAYCTDA